MTILRAEIDDVDDIVNMWAAPRRGKPPASGKVRAISVVTSEDQEEFGVAVESERKKALQGQHRQQTIPQRYRKYYRRGASSHDHFLTN